MKNIDKNDKLLYTLSRKSLISIIIYYLILLILGFCGATKIMLNLKYNKDNELLLQTVIGSLSVSSMLCCIQYFKRIYKACLDNRTEWPTQEQQFVHFGNILYFFLRPIYSYVFVIIMIYDYPEASAWQVTKDL